MKIHFQNIWLFCTVLFLAETKVVYASAFCTDENPCLTMKESLLALATELFGVGLILSDDINAVILGWIKFILALLGTIAFAAFVYAGAMYIISFGDEERVEKAKNTMKWTIFGILVILASYSIVSTLISATV